MIIDGAHCQDGRRADEGAVPLQPAAAQLQPYTRDVQYHLLLINEEHRRLGGAARAAVLLAAAPRRSRQQCGHALGELGDPPRVDQAGFVREDGQLGAVAGPNGLPGRRPDPGERLRRE